MSMLIYVIVGFVSGIVTGMGLGGGVVLIPALTFLKVNQLEAQLINLMYYVPVAIIATGINIKNKKIEKNIVIKIIIFGIIGSIIGAFISIKIELGLLKKIFSAILLVIGVYELFFDKAND